MTLQNEKWTFHKEKYFTNAIRKGIPIPILIPNDCIEQLQSEVVDKFIKCVHHAQEELVSCKECVRLQCEEACADERKKIIEMILAHCGCKRMHVVRGKSYTCLDYVLDKLGYEEQPVENGERK